MRAIGVCVFLLMTTLYAPGITAQSDAPPCAAVTAPGNDRLTPTETEAGMTFAGGPGRFVSEPFDVPEGTVIYGAQIDAANEYGLVARLVPAPRSDAVGSKLMAVTPDEQTFGDVGTTTIYTGGAYVLSVNAGGDWSVTLEF